MWNEKKNDMDLQKDKQPNQLWEFSAEKGQKGSLQKLQKIVQTLNNFMDLSLRSSFFPIFQKLWFGASLLSLTVS